MKYPTTPIFNN